MLLMGGVDLRLVDVHVLAVVRHDLAIDEATNHLDTLHQPGFAMPRMLEAGTRRSVLLRGVAGADAELESTLGQVIQRCRLPRQLNRVTHVVVDHECPQPNPLRRLRDGTQRDKWREAWADMVTDEHDIEAQLLSTVSNCDRRTLVLLAELIAEPEPCPHEATLPTGQ